MPAPSLISIELDGFVMAVEKVAILEESTKIVPFADGATVKARV